MSWNPHRTKPTECHKCGEIFNGLPMLQAEAHMELARYGPQAAENLVNEALEEEHENY